jgi:NADH-quinone oxidoreductase subunit K
MELLINSPVFKIGLTHYLMLSAILFVLAICSIFSFKRTLISILMAIELMLLAVNINFVAFSVYLRDIHGQIFSLFILVVAAAEAAIGLAIIIVHYRNCATIDAQEIKELEG